MRPPDRIKWWEPHHITRREAFEDLRAAGLLSVYWWIRPVTIAAMFAASAIGAMYWAYPAIQLPWTRILLTPVLAAVMVGMCVVLAIFSPRHIDIRRDRIQIHHGNSAVRINSHQLIDVQVEHGDPEAFVVVRYRRHDRSERTRRVAIARRVDRDALSELLAELRQQCADDGRGSDG